tara:strand:+ start:974 stop:1105 length:132 start_codon:yes stop_codon:yes gene_type:complete
MVQLGENGHLYEVSGDNFGKLPNGWFYREASICVSGDYACIGE